MSIEAMKQALEALEMYLNMDTMDESYLLEIDLAPKAITALRKALAEQPAQPERIQLTVRDFVVTVGDIEDAVGTPMYWAEWPNKEQP